MKSRIELVIFDLAGTTIQDRGQVPAAFTSALRKHGVAITPEGLSDVRGASKREIIERLVGPQDSGEVYQSFRQTLLDLFSAEGVEEISGTTETFAHLHGRKIKIALNTGFDRVVTECILREVGWDMRWIDAVVCGEDVRHGRPAPDLILRTMQICGVTDTQTVANVGDTVLDLLAGNRAGVRLNIAVLTGAHSKARLEQEPHTHILASVGDLQKVL